MATPQADVHPSALTLLNAGQSWTIAEPSWTNSELLVSLPDTKSSEYTAVE